MTEQFFEIQKAVLIPLRTWIDKQTEIMPTEEVWQVVNHGLTENVAKARIQYLRTLHPELHYRLMIGVYEK